MTFDFLCLLTTLNLKWSSHIATNDRNPFIFMTERYSILSSYHILFIHLSMNNVDPISCVLESAVFNMGIQAFLWHSDFIPFG